MTTTVNLRILSIQHDNHGLAEVERVVDRVDAMAQKLRALPGVKSVLPLSTCNRVEFVVDAPAHTSEQLASTADEALDVPASWDRYDSQSATDHLFRVCSGLESMVVGEREIAGQVRRALAEIQDVGQASPELSVIVEEALKTSRRVARETSLAHAGRSVVSVALDALEPDAWEDQHVLLVGTGAFAGATVAALRARGAHKIRVHSSSGRGAEFAASHNLAVAHDITSTLERTDLVITCRGTGTHCITPEHIPTGKPLAILDLSLQRDVHPDVAALPGIRHIDLESVHAMVSPNWAADTSHAEQIVADGVAAARTRLDARVLDPAVVSLRETVLELVNDEVARLPQNRTLDIDEAAQALRRLATRLLHVPSSRAKLAAASGRTTEYLTAMAELYGIGMPDDALLDQQCPATGLGVTDLENPQDKEEAV